MSAVVNSMSSALAETAPMPRHLVNILESIIRSARGLVDTNAVLTTAAALTNTGVKGVASALTAMSLPIVVHIGTMMTGIKPVVVSPLHVVVRIVLTVGTMAVDTAGITFCHGEDMVDLDPLTAEPLRLIMVVVQPLVLTTGEMARHQFVVLVRTKLQPVVVIALDVIVDRYRGSSAVTKRLQQQFSAPCLVAFPEVNTL